MSPAKVILLGFASFILVGAFLLCLPISNRSGEWASFVDALFTSTSSVCVTGLMVFDVAIELSLFGQFVVMVLIQIGGLGFVAITSLLFLLVGKKIDYATRLTIQESMNKDDSKDVVKTLVFVVIATFVCEFVGFVALAPSMIKLSDSFGMGLFRAMFMAVSGFCNAGFDSFGKLSPELSNLINYSERATILIPIMFLIVMGGVGFIVVIDLIKKAKTKKKLNLHTKVVLWMTAVLILLGAGLFLALEWNNPNTIGKMSVGDKILNGFFQSVTTRTAGFSAIDQSQMNQVTIILCEVLMFIGGSPASMAGGIKTTTFFILLLLVFKSSGQNGNIVYKNKKITNGMISKAMKIVIIAIGSLLVSCSLICIFEDGAFSIGAIVYECVSAICTVGLSFGITPLLSAGSKFVLMLLMYMGRIGMLTIPLAFKQKNHAYGIEYVDAKIIVG